MKKLLLIASVLCAPSVAWAQCATGGSLLIQQRLGEIACAGSGAQAAARANMGLSGAPLTVPVSPLLGGTTGSLVAVTPGAGLSFGTSILSVLYGTAAGTALQGSLLGTPGGVAGLNGSGLVPLAQMPSLAAQAGSVGQSTVLAGPTSGAGSPTQRALSAADVSGLAASATTDTTNAANITSGTLPGARLPLPASSVLGGAFSLGATSHQFVTGLSTAGALTTAQPAAADVSGLAASATTDTTNAGNISAGTLPAARLPNPSATTLGGIESAATVSHQFVTGISTSGVPSLAQPAAGDVSGLAPSATTDTTNASNIASGTLGAARLPAPSSTTLGGIQSAAAVTHQWISSISTAGVPALSQPAATDISGLGTAATVNIGTSGATIPLLNGVNTWSAAQGFGANAVTGSNFIISGGSISGTPISGSTGAFTTLSASGTAVFSAVAPSIQGASGQAFVLASGDATHNLQIKNGPSGSLMALFGGSSADVETFAPIHLGPSTTWGAISSTSGLWENQAMGGSNSSGTSAYYNYLNINDSVADASNQGSSTLAIALSVASSSSSGPKVAFASFFGMSAASGNTTGSGGSYSAAQFTAYTNVNDNGVGGARRGLVYGANPICHLGTSATYYDTCVGMEIDYSSDVATANGPPDKLIGLQVVQLSTAVSQGVSDDVGISINNQFAPSAGHGLKIGLDFGRYGGNMSVATDGTIIHAQGNQGGAFTIANGIDWSLGTASSYWLRLGSVFSVAGSGNILTSGTLGVAGTISLTGTTSNLVSFATHGIGAPTLTTASAGEKIALYPAISGSSTDYAMGVESNYLWFGVPTNDASHGFKFYASTTLVASISAIGVFGLTQATWADNQTCTTGQFTMDANYIYACTASNTVKRVALSTF